jgi:rod shape-determining protein MreD
MRFDFFQRDAGVANRLVPFTTTLLFAIISVVPLHIPALSVVTPAFTLMAVYHWTIYRSELLPPIAVFAVGMLLDLLNGTQYMGTSSLTLLLVRSALLSQRRFLVNRPFPILWSGFLLVTGAVVFFEWGLVSFLHGETLGAQPFIFEAVMTVASFPVGSYLLAWTQRGFLMRV